MLRGGRGLSPGQDDAVAMDGDPEADRLRADTGQALLPARRRACCRPAWMPGVRLRIPARGDPRGGSPTPGH